ncbi:MAG: Flp family type IVb pilin [Verrucomicrobiota bacterium]
MDRFNATLTRWFLELRDREEGQAAVEYGVLVALIIAVAIATIGILGGKVNGAFNAVNSVLP